MGKDEGPHEHRESQSEGSNEVERVSEEGDYFLIRQESDAERGDTAKESKSQISGQNQRGIRRDEQGLKVFSIFLRRWTRGGRDRNWGG